MSTNKYVVSRHSKMNVAYTSFFRLIGPSICTVMDGRVKRYYRVRFVGDNFNVLLPAVADGCEWYSANSFDRLNTLDTNFLYRAALDQNNNVFALQQSWEKVNYE